MDKKVFDIFSLSYLLRRSRSVQNIDLPKNWDQLVKLSTAGEEVLARLKEYFVDADEKDLSFALLLDLHGRELWMDVDKTDIEKLTAFVDSLLYSRTIDFPWVYGRLLYDRYFELLGGPSDQLDEEETAILLEGTPPGVVQAGYFVTGPFGLAISRVPRSLMPETKLPLWHCSDSGCNNLHRARLTYPSDGLREIAEYIVELSNNPSDERKWYLEYNGQFSHSKNFYNDSSIGDIAALLGSCLSERELQKLASHLLAKESQYIRSAIKQRGKYKDTFKGGADKVCSQLSTAECMQMILLLDDEAIIASLEELIHEKAIYLPPTEVRSPRLGGQGPSGWLDMYSELNHYGLRRVASNIPDIQLAYTRLRRLILDFYEQRPEISKSLTHLLRFQGGETLAQKIDIYLCTTDPRTVLEELISIHENGLMECIRSLNYHYLPPIAAVEDEKYVIDKILWKLGFDICSYSDTHAIFSERLNSLISSVRGVTNISEADREKTRSAAVNFFVSLEEILDLTLSYSSWVFLSDHFTETSFGFELSDGRALAHQYLNGLKIGSEKLEIRSDGRNTLYPLIEGMVQLGKYLRDLTAKNSKRFLRATSEMPGYSGKTDLDEFPFEHTLYVFDIGKEERKRLFAVLEGAAQRLKNANVCDIRNRLEHKRKDFPTKSEVEACCDAVATCLIELREAGLCPTEFYKVHVSVDSYRRAKEVYKSADGREISLFPLQYPLMSTRRPGSGPLNIIPGITIGRSAAPFYSYLEYSSDFDAMWRNFPRRRASNSIETTVEE